MIEVIKFYADWCGPCKLYAKAFDNVAEELKDEVKFQNINIETDTSGLAGEYKVTGIPTTVVIKNGVSKSRTGRLDEQELKNFILSE
jgi:thioredoxin 1